MHPSKARERGFNQAQWLAVQLGKRLHLPVLEAECHKRLPSQRSLNRAERQRNLTGAYRVEGPLPEWVIIIDDVVTTGATGHALALASLAAGATRVDVWRRLARRWRRVDILAGPMKGVIHGAPV